MNTKWLIKNWFRVGSKISWKLSLETLFSLLYFIPWLKNDFIYGIVQKKHEFVISYLEENYSYLIEKYKNLKSDLKYPEKNNIWVMWWQGEQNAPDLVKMCISSIKINANGADVVVITKDNYKNYADIPNYIIEKHEKGIISFAQLSDIMRVFLISKHGGLWLDATIFVSRPIPSCVFRKPIYSLHTSLKKTPFVQNDRIHCFVLGGTPKSKPLMFEREFLTDYWRTQDVIIDYYLLDYSIMFQYFNISDVREMIDNLAYTGEGLYQLVAILDEPYDKAKLDKILSENLFSKLIWNKKHRESGKETNYLYLLNHYRN